MAVKSNDVTFDLDAPAFSSDDFRMFEFKVKRCPRVIPHDWACCPFSHTNEKAKRRDPRLCKYSGTACPEFRRNGCCRRSDTCPFAHGIFECWMHPSRYRTQMCSEVLECKRRVCFFAHTEDELRRPMDDATWMQQHGSMLPEEMREAAGLMGHEPAVRQPDALSGLLAKQANSPMVAPATAAQGLIPAVHAPGAPPTAQNQAWPVLQQLAANGQIDATQLLQLVSAMNIQQPASGSDTPTKSATPESTVVAADLAGTLAAIDASMQERASSADASHANRTDLSGGGQRVGSWGSDGACAVSDALAAGVSAASLLPSSLDGAPPSAAVDAARMSTDTSAAALPTSLAHPVQADAEELMNLVNQLELQGL